MIHSFFFFFYEIFIFKNGGTYVYHASSTTILIDSASIAVNPRYGSASRSSSLKPRMDRREREEGEDICMPVGLSKPVDQLIKNYDTPRRGVVTPDRAYVWPWGPLTKSNCGASIPRGPILFVAPPRRRDAFSSPLFPKRESRISISSTRVSGQYICTRAKVYI